jgi:hypothetical protein
MLKYYKMAPRMNNSENHYNQNADYNECIVNDEEYNNVEEIYIGEEDDTVYETDEESRTRYNIVLCELYSNMHGDNANMYYNYLTIVRFKEIDFTEINDLAQFYNSNYNLIQDKTSLSPIGNFATIISNINYIKPEIAEHHVLSSGHSICILKTFWLKLVQRCWKNIFNKRKEILQKRCSLESINYREINGRWPNNCINMPEFRGMLSTLKTFNCLM